MLDSAASADAVGLGKGLQDTGFLEQQRGLLGNVILWPSARFTAMFQPARPTSQPKRRDKTITAAVRDRFVLAPARSKIAFGRHQEEVVVAASARPDAWLDRFGEACSPGSAYRRCPTIFDEKGQVQHLKS